ncbi:VCBS domain-containing protein, partial [Brevundimonas alba]
ESDPQTLTITITGTNDGPVAAVATNSVTEDATITGSVSATDADDGVASYELTNEAPAGLTFNPNGSYSFDAASYDYLAAGATETVTVSFIAIDGEGAESAPQTLTITVTGTNDLPVVTAATGATTEGHAVSGTLPVATDADAGSSIVSYQLTAAAPAGFVLNPNGAWTFTGQGYDSLAAGQTANLVVNYTATDDKGGVSAPQTLTLTITGIAGTSGNDTIIGTAGNDTLEGGAGADNIYGRDGDDIFIGNVDGVGDAYRGEGGSDTVDYSGATGAMNINLTNAASGGGVGTDQLYSIENAIGSRFNDTIAGSAVNNVITGGLGDDTINGGAGTDTVVVNADAANGIAVQGASRITVTTADGVDVLRGVEAIRFNNATIQVNGTTGNAFAYGVDDAASATENGSVTGSVRTNDIEIEGEAMTITSARAGAENAGGAMTTLSGPTVIMGAHGTLTISADGSYVYAATDNSLAGGEVVTDVFTYNVNDIAGEGSLAAITFTVTGANDAPVATNGSSSVNEDATAGGTVAATDVDGDSMTYVLVNEGPAGLTFNPDGTYTFDASAFDSLNAGETETVTFQFQARDENGTLSNVATQTITINGVNDAPVATDATDEVDEDLTVSGQLIASDEDGSVASFQVVGEAPEGFTLGTNGSYSFDADSYDYVADGETEEVVVTYTVTDDQGQVSDPRTLTITITGSNDAPVISVANGSVDEDQVVTGSVTATDVDGDASAVTYAVVGETPAGLTFNPDGTYSFDASAFDTLNAGDSDTVSFDVQGTDEDGGLSEIETITITINGVNDAPVATNATDEVDEDLSITGTLTASDEDGSVASFQVVGEAPEGFTLGTDGAYSFDADSYDYVAEGQTEDVVITYTVTDDQGQVSDPRTLTITITGSNDAPVISVANGSVNEDQVVTGSVTATDVDGEASEVTYEVVGETPAGLTFNPDGTYSFDASAYDSLNAGDTDTVSFDVQGTDEDGGLSEVETITITINGVNDLPVATDATDEVDEDLAISGQLVASDEDGSVASFQIVGEAPEGFTLDEDGAYTFDADSYDYVADGETEEVVVTYTVTDDQGLTSDERTLTITITGSNDAPVISVANGSVDEDQIVTGSVTATDVDGDALEVTYEVVGETPAGLTFNPDGTYSFDASAFDTLNAGDSDTVTFNVQGTDEDGGLSEIETITITINGVNDAPVATNATDEVDEDLSITGTLTASDEDGSIASFHTVGETPEGFELDEDGSYTFDAASYDYLAEGETEDVVVSYFVTDDSGQNSATRTLTITITGSNDAPVGDNATAQVTEGGTITGSVSASDIDGDVDVDGYALTSMLTGLDFNPDGTWEFDASGYDLNVGETQNVSFTFTATDDEGAVSEERTVTITISGASNQVVLADGGDTFVGNNRDETVTGGNGDDQILAGGGVNVVNAGAGDDSIITGSGADTISGGQGDDSIISGSGADRIDAGAGNDTVNAGSGDDTVISDAGNDILVGGSGIDTLSFHNSTAGVAVNLSLAGRQTTVDGADQYIGFENIVGTAFNDTLTGDDQNNRLEGGDGADTLNGGVGVDTMIGGAGNDTYFVDHVSDVVLELAGGGTDRVFTTLANVTIGANIEGLYGQSAAGHRFTGDAGANTLVGFTGDDVLIGGDGSDYLIGGAGNDTLYGGSGALNTMQGGTGNDTYYVDANDTYLEFGSEGTDLAIVSLNTHTLRANVENMTFNGTGAFTGTGNALDNVITGGAGNDILRGAAGNDTLIGGAGTDIARYSGAAAGYSVTQEGSGWRVIDTNLADGDDGSDLLQGIETLMFGNGSTRALTAPAPLAPLPSAKHIGDAAVLPGLMDDAFLMHATSDEPLVLPSGGAGFGGEFDALVLPVSNDFVLTTDLFTSLHLDNGLLDAGQPTFDARDDFWTI